ncbi:peroxidase 29-like [Nymphaea colorata]|nr:peroxidase 29-like [Nymphaea colorata]
MARPFLKLLLFSAVPIFCFLRFSHASLSYNFYERTCPQLDSLVNRAMAAIFLDLTAPSALVRLMFHDCQVQGCDASILLDSGGGNVRTEMLSGKNFGIRQRSSIQMMKEAVESECPGQVSCADLIVMAASKSVTVSGGPRIDVPLGRKDSTTANNLLADSHLPPASMSVDDLLNLFSSMGMNMEEAVAMLGSHTLGVGHCINIADRLYEPKGDDYMSSNYGAYLSFMCPTRVPLTNLTALPNDLTPTLFDNQYFRNILAGRAPFTIDSRIATDPRTSAIVAHFAGNQEHFFQAFSSAFLKLSYHGVLTGDSEGEIRRQCNQVN